MGISPLYPTFRFCHSKKKKKNLNLFYIAITKNCPDQCGALHPTNRCKTILRLSWNFAHKLHKNILLLPPSSPLTIRSSQDYGFSLLFSHYMLSLNGPIYSNNFNCHLYIDGLKICISDSIFSLISSRAIIFI